MHVLYFTVGKGNLKQAIWELISSIPLPQTSSVDHRTTVFTDNKHDLLAGICVESCPGKWVCGFHDNIYT